MAKSYSQIQQQIETLQREADKLRQKEVDEVVARIKEAIETYELTASDLGFTSARGRRSSAPAKSRAAGKRASKGVKFRDPAGNTWGGRGPRPQWLREALAAGKSLEDFAV
jgi:DNA-binding protein H-NS